MQAPWETQIAETREKIEQLEAQLVELVKKNDVKNIQRTKNMISAYESRLGKRAKFEDCQAQIASKESELSKVFSIIMRELKPERYAQIYDCIMKEVP